MNKIVNYVVWSVIIITFALIGYGIYYNHSMARDCIESNDPGSKACFKYSVYSGQMRNVNVY